MTDAISEKDRRLSLWHSLSKEPLDDIQPQRLRDLSIYGGAQGIWVDKTHTASPEIGNDGATVAILHTGRHYPDDLSDDGVIYHYPKTSRPPARDETEIQATKNSMIHHLPIFVILPGKISQARRCLKIGWVCDFDDNNREFLILFSMSPVGFRRMLERLGKAAKMAFGVHPHMLRHACGFKLANQGVDTRSLQHYLGHKNIQHTVRYTELSPDRFRGFWKD